MLGKPDVIELFEIGIARDESDTLIRNTFHARAGNARITAQQRAALLKSIKAAVSAETYTALLLLLIEEFMDGLVECRRFFNGQHSMHLGHGIGRVDRRLNEDGIPEHRVNLNMEDFN